MTKEQLENLQTLALIDYKTRLHVRGVRIIDIQQCSKTVATKAAQPLVLNTKQSHFLN